MRSAGCQRVLHHTEKHEAVLPTEATLLSKWVEIHKTGCRNIGSATLVKTLTQLVWYPPYSSSRGAQVFIFRTEEWQLRLLLFILAFKARNAHAYKIIRSPLNFSCDFFFSGTSCISDSRILWLGK